MNYVYKLMPSPIGELKLLGSDRGLAAILWKTQKESRIPVLATTEDPGHPVLVEAERQLAEYFAGKRKKFDLKLDFVGTDFQKSVWAELLKIPFGETRTYGQIAKRLGNENAMRAVGAANGRNPIPIVAPCHRVIGASGSLVGFGGGLKTKAQLLDLERGELAFEFDVER
ncbi:MAG TPA: methylated-DNA--[protein]-cysteine S-methyltransferase [Candidatus Dormibacteraeota bacterium]|nr:methylated-DNA--[protein]-cysteine S-methyltransferase [Candidatus Dormibacteraeota bacterium]